MTLKFPAAVLIATLGLLLTGCGSSVPYEGMLLVDVETADALNYRIQWQNDLALPKGQHIQSVSVLPSGNVAVVETGNLIALLDGNTGRRIWRKPIASSLERLTEPLQSGDFMVICSQARVYVLRMDNGEVHTANRLEYLTNRTPVLNSGLIIAGTPSGLVFAQSVMTGFIKWRYQLSAAIDAPLVWADGLVAVTDEAGEVAVLTPRQGRIIWRRHKAPWDRITTAPDATADTVYVACRDQKLYAFDRASGEVFWTYLTEDPLTTSPVALGQAVYQQVPSRGLVALDAFDGRELWRAPVPGQPVQLTKQKLMVQDGTTVRTLDARDGAVLSEVAFNRAQGLLADAETNASLYLYRGDGRILKMSPR